MHESTHTTAAWTAFMVTILALGWPVSKAGAEREKHYVGSKACEECHGDEYNKFLTYAKKSRSFARIKVMKKGLTDQEFETCFECHTTGYGKPGGFRSEHDTPRLKNAGCEVCHGPGSLHCETEAAEDILGSVTSEECERCHRADRVEAFDYKPLINGGAH